MNKYLKRVVAEDDGSIPWRFQYKNDWEVADAASDRCRLIELKEKLNFVFSYVESENDEDVYDFISRKKEEERLKNLANEVERGRALLKTEGRDHETSI